MYVKELFLHEWNGVMGIDVELLSPLRVILISAL